MMSNTSLERLKQNCIQEQKSGVHFILASVIVWLMITFIQMQNFTQIQKNWFIFIASALLLPCAFVISKCLHIQFQNKKNPLNSLGLYLSMNQMLYLLIAMWIFPIMPDKLLLILTIIFGAHLFPFSWLYQSRIYLVFSIFIPFSALLIDAKFGMIALSLFMIGTELLFSLLLLYQHRR